MFTPGPNLEIRYWVYIAAQPSSSVRLRCPYPPTSVYVAELRSLMSFSSCNISASVKSALGFIASNLKPRKRRISSFDDLSQVASGVTDHGCIVAVEVLLDSLQ